MKWLQCVDAGHRQINENRDNRKDRQVQMTACLPKLFQEALAVKVLWHYTDFFDVIEDPSAIFKTEPCG